METDSSNDSDCTPPEILEAFDKATMQLLPLASRKRYEDAYSKFMVWFKVKQCKKIGEKEVLAYIAEKSKVFKASTLWSEYSMLKATINLHNCVDISKFCKVISFLKRKSDGYIPKKSKTLTKEQIEKFMVEAPNETHLMTKVALVLSIFGALRRDELTKISLDDIEDVKSALIVKVPCTKTKILFLPEIIVRLM